MLLVATLLGLAIAVFAYPPGTFERSLERFLATIPGPLDPVWAFFADLAWFWAILLVAVALVRRRWLLVGQALAAVVIGALAGLLAARLALGSWPDVADAVFGTTRAMRFPAVRLGEAAAVMLTITPQLIRPLRRLDQWILGLGVLGTALGGVATPTGTLAAVLAGMAAAAAVRLVFGTSIGRPEIDKVSAGLADLGVRAHALAVADRQVAGVFYVDAVDQDGQPLLVKVYGRDAYDTQFIAKLWRSLWYRGGARIRMGRLETAEHEALVALLARQGGVPTREVAAAGATAGDDALLVLRGLARPVSSLEQGELDDALLRGAWAALARLEELGIAHGRIDADTTVVVAGEAGFVDFADAVTGAGAEQLLADRAQLLMTTAALAGPDAAVGHAVDALGREGVTELLPYLQPAALGGPLRRTLKDAAVDTDEFRRHVADALDVEPPELVRLRRVSWRSVIQIALLGVATYAILSAAGGVDWSEFRTTLGQASVGWVVAGFVVAQLPRLTQSVSTLGSVPGALPFGPVYAMQLATGYMNLALPSNLARMAVNVRFFQRQGLSPPTAISAGAIDSFASTVVQIVLLLVLLLFSESSVPLDVSFPTGGIQVLLWAVVGLAIAAVLVFATVGRLRRAIVSQVRRWWPDVRAALGALQSARKLALLVVGSLATEVLFAAALGVFCRSFGYDISIAELLVINIGVALLGTLVPVPGNIGVAEFGLTVGLVAAGMPDEAALATVLLYRISTFYLPPVWGFCAMVWLQRNRYL